jgi:hypothetical protein
MNSKNKTAVRIMAWILALLMIFSLATLTVSIFVEQCGPTEEVPHDHNGDGKPDHDDAGHDHDGEVDTDDNVDTGDDEF